MLPVLQREDDNVEDVEVVVNAQSLCSTIRAGLEAKLACCIACEDLVLNLVDRDVGNATMLDLIRD